MGERGDFLVQPQGFVKVTGSDGSGHGLDIQFQRAGGIAVGRLLVDAQTFPSFQFLFGEHPLLTIDMGGGTFFNFHGSHFLFARIAN